MKTKRKGNESEDVPVKNDQKRNRLVDPRKKLSLSGYRIPKKKAKDSPTEDSKTVDLNLVTQPNKRSPSDGVTTTSKQSSKKLKGVSNVVTSQKNVHLSVHQHGKKTKIPIVSSQRRGSPDSYNDRIKSTEDFNRGPNFFSKDVSSVADDVRLDPAFAEEPMDWDDLDSSLQVELKKCAELSDIKRPDETFKGAADFRSSVLDSSYFRGGEIGYKFIVIDTNILISQLQLIEKILDQAEEARLIVYIPWSVLHELDLLSKSKRTIWKSAKDAIIFLQKHLPSKDSKIFGQTGSEELESANFFAAKNTDDKIIQACLQLQSRGVEVVLSTDDRNLSTKAAVSQIAVLSASDLAVKISETPMTRPRERSSLFDEPDQTNAKLNGSVDVPEVIRASLEIVLETEMKLAFGEKDWIKIICVKPKARKPLWTLKDIFRCFKKHWIAVISLVPGVHKCDKSTFDQLSLELKSAQPGSHSKASWDSLSTKDKLSIFEKSRRFLGIFVERSYGDNLKDNISNLEAAEGTLLTEELFRILWYEIFRHVVSYCLLFNVSYETQLGVGNPLPADEVCPKPDVKNMESDLFDVVTLVDQLTTNFENVLADDRREVSLGSPALVSFHKSFLSFFKRLHEKSPRSGPIPPHRKDLTIKALQDWLNDPANTSKLKNGLNQLLNLRKLIVQCQMAFSEIRHDPRKFLSFSSAMNE